MNPKIHTPRSVEADPHHFSTAEQAVDFLVSRYKSRLRDVSNIDIAALMQNVVAQSKEADVASPPPNATPVLMKRFRWVIRDDDLNLMDSLLDGLKASASAGFFMAAGVSDAAQWGALVGLAIAILKLVRGATNRGKQLPADLFAILAALKDHGAASSDELAEKLSAVDPVRWDPQGVQSALDSLKAIPMTDGTVRPLVAQGPDKKWVVSNI